MYPVEDRYIRRIIELDSEGDKPIRIIICMLAEGSRRLLRARFLQSDIASKRVVGYQEFELSTYDQCSSSSK